MNSLFSRSTLTGLEVLGTGVPDQVFYTFSEGPQWCSLLLLSSVIVTLVEYTVITLLDGGFLAPLCPTLSSVCVVLYKFSKCVFTCHAWSLLSPFLLKHQPTPGRIPPSLLSLKGTDQDYQWPQCCQVQTTAFISVFFDFSRLTCSSPPSHNFQL